MASADGSITIEFNADDNKVNAKLAKLHNKVSELQHELNSKAASKSLLEKQLDDAKMAAKETEDAIRRLNTERARLSDLSVNYDSNNPGEVAASMEAYSRISEIDAELKSQNATLKEQDKTTQQIDREYTKITDQINKISEKLNKAKTESGSFEAKLIQANSPIGRMGAAADGAKDKMDKLGTRISGLAKRVFVFSLITSGLRAMASYMGKALKTNTEFQSALANVKGALLTAFQPIYEAIVPALITLMNILARIINFIGSLFALLAGKSTSQMASNAKELNSEADAIGAVGGAAKKASKQLASFDEINQLQDTSSGGGGGSGSGTAVDISGISELEGNLNNILGTVAAIAAGFAAWKIARALGADLKTTAGLALAVAGGVKFAFEWFDALTKGISFDNLIGMVGSLALVVGGLALAFGKTAAAWGLIIGGAAILIAAIKDIAENGMNLQNVLALIAGLFAIGLGIGMLTGNFIPLLIMGIAGLVAAFVVLMGHGDKLADGIVTAFQGIVDFVTGVFSGDMDQAMQGLGEIFDGLKGIVGAVIDSVKDVFLGFIEWLDERTEGSFKPWFETISGLFTGLFDSLKEIFGGIIDFISGVFTGDWDKAWKGVKNIFKGIWNGIVSLIEGAVNFIINGVNLLIKGLNKMMSFKLPDWAGGKEFGINIPTISRVSIPRLAQGAVIPPNREFLAVLGDQKSGTNIEAPLDTIVQAFRMAMSEAGGFGSQNEAVLYIGEQEMGKLVYRLNNEESRRVGVSLAGV